MGGVGFGVVGLGKLACLAEGRSVAVSLLVFFSFSSSVLLFGLWGFGSLTMGFSILRTFPFVSFVSPS